MPVTLKSVSSLFRGLVRGVLEGPDDDAELPDGVDGYDITGRIGKGGMGAVYLAKDTNLDSNVAIKFVAGAYQADEEARRRFLREARAMAAVHHPNIVHVYGFGESDGRPYIVMEYVDGESLADRIKDNGPLDIDDALWVVHQTICALAAAWEKGLVHRDIKPSNLLVDDKAWLRVCDFGLAKPSRSANITAMTTESGDIAGTPHYMSPEQATGKELDFRADIYSLGVVLYELVVGRPPFRGDSPGALIAQHLETPVPDVSTTGRSKRWVQLAGLIAWMTEKDPERRPSSYDELLESVEGLIENPKAFAPWILERLRAKRRRRWLLSAAAVVVAAGLTGWGLWVGGYFDTPPTIAVLPFEYQGADSEWAHLGTIVADGLTAKFESSGATHAVPFATVRGLGRGEGVPEAAASLSADWVVSGDITVAGGDFVFGFELVSADGVTVRPGIHSGPITPLADTLDALADELFQILELAVENDTDLESLRTPTFEAWDHLAAGLELEEHWDDIGSLQEAASRYERALEADPEMAAAHARLAIVSLRLVRYGTVESAELIGRARTHAEQAYNRNPDLSEAMVAMGMAYVAAGDSALAERTLQRALVLAPGNDAALREVAELYLGLEQLDAAEAAYGEAIQVRPNYWGNYYALGRFFFVNRSDSERARLNLWRAIEENPDGTEALITLGALEYVEGDWEASAVYFERALQNDPLNNFARSNLAFLYYSQGLYERALTNWREVADAEPGVGINHANVGDALVRLDRPDEARPRFEEAVRLFRASLAATGRDPEKEGQLSMALAALAACDEAVSTARGAVELQPASQWVRYYALVAACRCDHLDWAEELAVGLIADDQLVLDIARVPDLQAVRELPGVRARLEGSGALSR